MRSTLFGALIMVQLAACGSSQTGAKAGEGGGAGNILNYPITSNTSATTGAGGAGADTHVQMTGSGSSSASN